MRLSRRSLQAASACAAVTASAASSALAVPFIYDLRWSDGSDIREVALTQTLDLWVRLEGTNGINTDEALANSYITVRTTQENLGAIGSGGGGITSAIIAAGFNEAGSRPGASNELNGDGVLDWGASVTTASNTNYMLVRNATVGGAAAGGTLGQQVNANTWEFKIASFTVEAFFGGPFGGKTHFNVVQPEAKNTVGDIFTYASARIDGSTFNIARTDTRGAFANSSGATLVIPEPASALLGAAAVGLLARRRRS